MGVEEGFPFVTVLEDDQVLQHQRGIPQAHTARVVSLAAWCRVTCTPVPQSDALIRSLGSDLDLVILGPLDWRLRSLQYAQRNKVSMIVELGLVMCGTFVVSL
eukprot:6373103-Amphidinium_carterae.1